MYTFIFIEREIDQFAARKPNALTESTTITKVWFAPKSFSRFGESTFVETRVTEDRKSTEKSRYDPVKGKMHSAFVQTNVEVNLPH